MLKKRDVQNTLCVGNAWWRCDFSDRSNVFSLTNAIHWDNLLLGTVCENTIVSLYLRNYFIYWILCRQFRSKHVIVLIGTPPAGTAVVSVLSFVVERFGFLDDRSRWFGIETIIACILWLLFAYILKDASKKSVWQF